MISLVGLEISRQAFENAADFLAVCDKVQGQGDRCKEVVYFQGELGDYEGARNQTTGLKNKTDSPL